MTSIPIATAVVADRTAIFDDVLKSAAVRPAKSYFLVDAGCKTLQPDGAYEVLQTTRTPYSLDIGSTMNICKFIKRFIKDEAGPTAVEYAVMLALIMGAIVGTVTTFGGAAGNMFGNISDDVEEIMGD